jgi:hypothetical protein
LNAEPLGRLYLKNVTSLREEAVRTRRLAQDATDRRLQTDLLTYARDLEVRAARMEGALNSRGVEEPPKPVRDGTPE